MAIMHFTQIILKENIMDVGPPPKPNWFLHELIHNFYYFGIMKNSVILIKNQENGKIIWKSKKSCESAYQKGKVASLLKTRFFLWL